MGWFDEQIKQRKLSDDKAFEEAFYEIADSVTGSSIARLLADDRARTLGAVEEVLRYYGCRITASREGFGNINDELEYLCRPSGIMRRTVRLEKGWYRDAFGPFLGTDLRTGSIVALIPDKKSGKYRFLDGETGKRTRVNKKNALYFDSEAICFYKPLPLRKLKPADLFRYGLSHWSTRDIVIPILLMAVTALLGLLTPKLSHFLFQDVFEKADTSFLLATVFFLACVSVSRILLNTVHSLITARNSIGANVSLEAAMMMRVLSLPADFFKKYSSGEIMQRISYANTLCDTFVDLIFNTGITSLLSVVYLSQIFVYARALLLPSVIIILATVLLSVIVTLIGIGTATKAMEAQSAESGVSFSLISGIRKIRLAGAEKRAFARWGHKYAAVSGAVYNDTPFMKASGVLISAISSVGAIFLYFAAVKSRLSVADFYAFNTAFAMVFGAFMTVADITDAIAGIRPTLTLIRPILDAEPEVAEGKEPVTKLSGGIELNNVTFRYTESMPPVIDNLSLRIRPGQYVAIVGSTGCGKSTLMRLMLGFEKPQRGAIYYDGRDLSTIDLKSLRRSIGTVMQEGKLFQGDIYSNITISAPWLTLDEAWEAAENAGIADEIRRMPMGMQTLVTEGSGGISGGQRQRLMIARAIAPKPKILMFDEATSALDNITQKIVSDSLDALRCTRIVIAHRLSTIRHCDRIIYLDRGRILEDGTYEELIALNGRFAELVARQRLDGND